MNVLYVNHTGALGGAERSLLDLLESLPSAVSPILAAPPGRLTDAAATIGVPVRPIAGTDASFRLDARATPRAAAALVRSAAQLRRAARGVDVVHANTIRGGVAAALAGPGLPPIVVQVRDCLPAGPAAALTRRLLAARATALVANSSYTAAAFGARATCAYPAVAVDRFARPRQDRGGQPPVLAVVAQLTPWKGQEDAIRLLARVRERHPETTLLLVGAATFATAATRFDNLGYERRLRDLAAELGLGDAVQFLGERDDLPEVLAGVDILLAPSWEEPFGRAVVEGMAAGLAVVATAVGGPAEVIEDGVDGILLPPRDPDRWAAVVAELLDDAGRRAELGAAAAESAKRFAPERLGRQLEALYADVVAGRTCRAAAVVEEALP